MVLSNSPDHTEPLVLSNNEFENEISINKSCRTKRDSLKSVKIRLKYAKIIPKLLFSTISRMKKGLVTFGHNFCIPIIVCLSRSSFAVLILLLQWQMCQAMSDINNNKNRCCLMPGKRKRNKEGRIKKKCVNYLPVSWVESQLEGHHLV